MMIIIMIIKKQNSRKLTKIHIVEGTDVTKMWMHARELRTTCMWESEKMWRVVGWPEKNMELSCNLSLQLLQSQIPHFHCNDPYLRSKEDDFYHWDFEQTVRGWTLFLRSSGTMRNRRASLPTGAIDERRFTTILTGVSSAVARSHERLCQCRTF